MHFIHLEGIKDNWDILLCVFTVYTGEHEYYKNKVNQCYGRTSQAFKITTLKMSKDIKSQNLTYFSNIFHFVCNNKLYIFSLLWMNE